MSSRAASNRGFTLIEFVVVIGVSLIVMGFALPTAFNLYRRQLVDDAARDLTDALRRARSQAIANVDAAPHGVKVVTASSTFVLFEGASYAARNTAKDEEITYADSVTFEATSTETVFSQLYGTSTTAEAWKLYNSNASKTVSIGAFGAISIE